MIKNDINYLIKHTKFPFLWSSQILSQLTINMMNFLLLVRIYENTNSTLATSLLWVSYAIPVLIIGPIASALVDYWDRRNILIFTNLLQAIVVLYYALFFREKVFFIYGLTFFYSLINQFYVPAESASVTFVVENKHLPHANGLIFITQQLSLILGFALASIFNRFLGFNTSLIICAVLLFTAFICVIFLPKMKMKINEKGGIEETFFSFFKSIYKGYKYIRTNNNILLTFVLLIIVQVLYSIIIVSVPMIADQLLNIPANLSGIYIVIPAGLGSMLGAIYMPTFLKNKWRKRSLIETSLFTIAILFLIITFLVSLFSTILKIIFSGIIIFFIGAFFIGILIPSQTYLQENTPDEYKGRIFGNMWFITTLATLIPVIFYGAMSEIFGIKILMTLISVVCFLSYYLSKYKVIRFMKNES